MSPTAPFLAPERDPALKRGRPKPSGGSTPYSLPGVVLNTDSTLSLSGATDYYGPLWIDTPILVDQLAFEITTLQAGNARCGMYPADTDYQPVGAPLADSGDISTNTTGVKTYTPTTPIYLPRGRYVTVINSSASPNVRIYQGNLAMRTLSSTLGSAVDLNNLFVGRAYAAFPTPGTLWTSVVYGSNGPKNMVLLRILNP